MCHVALVQPSPFLPIFVLSLDGPRHLDLYPDTLRRLSQRQAFLVPLIPFPPSTTRFLLHTSHCLPTLAYHCPWIGNPPRQPHHKAWGSARKRKPPGRSPSPRFVLLIGRQSWCHDPAVGRAWHPKIDVERDRVKATHAPYFGVLAAWPDCDQLPL